jgi:hypothetical protein
LSNWRHFVCWPLIVGLPVSLTAADTAVAVLHSNGSVLLNNATAPSTSALFDGDRIETQNNAVAWIEFAGSAAHVDPVSIVKLEGDELFLEHGSLSVNTTRGLKVRVGCVTVTPVHSARTRYDVSDVDGRVSVSAIQDDVYVESRSMGAQQAKQSERPDRIIVKEGEQKTREEKCGGPILNKSPVAGKAGVMNSPYAIWSATGVIVGACWALCRGDNPTSPDSP